MDRDLQIQASILLKVANAQGNPRQFLQDILFKKYTTLLGGNGRIIINTSTGGSTASWTIPEGFNDQEIMEIAYLALQRFDTQVNFQDPTGNPINSQIGQVDNASRLISYPSFKSIQL